MPYFDEMEKACGEIGLVLAEFYELTPRQFQNYYTGFSESKERSEKEYWEQTRWLAYYAAAGNLKKNTKIKDLIQFPWDEKTLAPKGKPTEKEIQESKEYWAKIDKKRGQSGN